MTRTIYVILRNFVAFAAAYALMTLSARINPALPHDFHLLLGAVFASGFIADSAVSHEAARSSAAREPTTETSEADHV